MTSGEFRKMGKIEEAGVRLVEEEEPNAETLRARSAGKAKVEKRKWKGENRKGRWTWL